MKYVYYVLAVFAILQALVVSYFLGHAVEDMGAAVVVSFLYGAVSGSLAGKLLILGWEEE